VTAITQPEAAVVGAVLVFVASMVGLYVQNRRNTTAQRADHAATADMVREIRDDMRDVKSDIRDVKDEVRSHGDRLRHLEHWNVVKDENTQVQDALTDIADQLNNRKRSA
jgi:hypothetical protein